MEYVFRAPTYQPFPYELLLAVEEVAALTGARAVRRGESLAVNVERALPPDLLRRLAFTSFVEAPAGPLPTDAYLLEQSAHHARNGPNGWLPFKNSSTRKESTYLTHGLHRYKGKFYPQLCRSLINIAEPNAGDLILDPFMGSGTTLVECAISGLDSLGFDLNPLACLIAATKLNLLRTPIKRLEEELGQFESFLVEECKKLGLRWSGPDSAEPNGDASFPAATMADECGVPDAEGEIQRWFPPAVRQKLVAVLRASSRLRNLAVRNFVRVCLSDLVRSVSQQDPRDLRIRRRETAIDDAPVLAPLVEKSRKEFEKLKAGVSALGGLRSVGLARAELRDARLLERQEHSILSSRRVRSVVTSPPYANALPYIDTDRLSILVLGLASSHERGQIQKGLIGNREIPDRDRLLLEAEMEGKGGLRTFPASVAKQLRKVLSENRMNPVGFRRRNLPSLLYQYFRDMRRVMDRLHRVVAVGGSAFVVLGDSRTQLGNGEEVKIQTTDHLALLAEQTGWKFVDAWPITVTVEDLAHVRNAITDNRILVFERRINTAKRSIEVSR